MSSAQLVLSLTLGLLMSAASCRPQLQPDTRSGLVIPERIISPQARLDYAIAHYWDKSPQWTPERAAELELWIADYSGLIAGQAPSKVRQPLSRRGRSRSYACCVSAGAALPPSTASSCRTA